MTQVKKVEQEEKVEELHNDIVSIRRMCNVLMKTPHYKKLGEAGIFAVVQKANAMGIHPLIALDGGMYCVGGKVELTAAMMNELIRSKQHSISKDRKSNNEVCILHGRRADNGDTWTESFSIEEAKLAGIYGTTWKKYPRDMLFARALSRLARQLFPDVIKGCYVAGEISGAIDTNLNIDPDPIPPIQISTYAPHNEPEEVSISLIDDKSSCESKNPQSETQNIKRITAEQYAELEKWMGDCQELRNNLMVFMEKHYGESDLSKMPVKIYSRALQSAIKRRKEAEEAYGEELQAMEA